MADLKPCPFCGGEAELRHYEDFNKDFSSVYKFYVQCKECESQSVPTANVERATNAWNTRKPMETVVAKLEKIKKSSSGCEGVSCKDCKYTEWCFEGEQTYKVTLDKAISIVQGKE